MAKDGKEAANLMMVELGESKLVVKSKSNLTKEMELVKLLERSGIRVIETDSGDRIIQIAHEKPSILLVKPAILVGGKSHVSYRPFRQADCTFCRRNSQSNQGRN